MHPNCRCSTSAYMDDDEYNQWLDSYQDHGLAFEDWKNSVASNGGADIIKLGVGSSSKQGETTRIELGEIDTDKIDEAIQYFSDEIRDRETEIAIVIDKNGKVTQFISTSTESVNIFDVDLDGASITHNHPVSNGIVSFGEDDFYFLQENQNVASFRCCNLEYDYVASVRKDISQVTYNELYLKALTEYSGNDDLQHAVFEELRARGYISYDRISKNAD